MTDLRSTLKPGDLRVLPVAGLHSMAQGSNPVRVYYDSHLERWLVGKVLAPPPHIVASEGDRSEWLTSALLEGRILSKLREHPNVLPVIAVLDVYSQQAGLGVRRTDEVEIFTPLMEAGSAFDRMQKGEAFTTAEAVEVAKGVALGLAELHRLGYLHRDVKTPNIFIEHTASGPRGLLSDLGLAIECDPGGPSEGYPQPTPWIAPEQMTPNPVATVSSDLFGIGASLVEMLRGFDYGQFDRGRAAARMERGQLPLPKQHYAPPPWAPPRVRSLIRGLTKSNMHERRPRTARAVADALATPVPPWSLVDTGIGHFRYASPGQVSVSVTGTHHPRLEQWTLALAADRGNGWRSLRKQRVNVLSDGPLAQLFDAALAVWSR